MSKLWWQTKGEGKDDLVLLHGWGLNAEVWHYICEELSSHFRLHRVDLPGYGRSQGFGALSLEEMADIVLAQAPEQASVPVAIPAQAAWPPALQAQDLLLLAGEERAALLGMTNSRLKDYLDLWVLLDRETLDVDTLGAAIAATFVRRGMPVPAKLPLGLTDEFATDPSRQALWRAFLKKNDLAEMSLIAVATTLRTRLEPALHRAAQQTLD